MLAGYYLISYVPPIGTFDSNDYQRVRVRVNRRAARVYTRDGFYGRAARKTDSVASATSLQDTIFSPLRYSGLNVNIAAGYTNDAEAGYFIRSWIHLDANDVNMVETEEGVRIELEVLCLTSDINAQIHDFNHVKHTLNINHEAITRVFVQRR